MFMATSLPVGGAETLLVNLIRGMNHQQFLPELCCLKKLGLLGTELAEEIPAFAGIMSHKYDLRVLPRLRRLFRERRIDAVVTVGAGDKMFWGRLTAAIEGVPVVVSALHSTGWPDKVGWLNRRLTRITDAFIGVAVSHGRHLVDNEHFPEEKVRVIPNGIDTREFNILGDADYERTLLGLSSTDPVIGIVAALRPEKNHELFLRVATLIRIQLPRAKFLIIGDGPRRDALEDITKRWGLADAVQFLGTRRNVSAILAAMDVVLLTSHNEANPVSVLEAMACSKPVVATRVGSLPESVHDGINGYLVDPDDADQMARRVCNLLQHPRISMAMGEAGRQFVLENASLEGMVRGYEEMLIGLYARKAGGSPMPQVGTEPLESDVVQATVTATPANEE